MKILSIGNSFSQDAYKYLHALAEADGFSLETVNLYIGGCTLSRHAENLRSGEAAYLLEVNGKSTERYVSIAEAVAMGGFDAITLQQASHESTKKATYYPHIEELAAYVRASAPAAKLLIHETWAYEEGSDRLFRVAGYKTAAEMMRDICAAYREAAARVGADGVIPSGRAMLRLAETTGLPVHRDTFHASRGAGRYLLALVWYATLTGRPVDGNAFSDLEEPVDATLRVAVIEAVKQACEEEKPLV